MTTEALKLALEALETNNKAWKHLADSGDAGFWEAEEQGFYELSVKAITAIKEALAQPEQESVTWRNAAIRVGEDLCSVGPFGYYDMTAEQWLDWALSVVTVHAPPPQRKPLTDEEIDELSRSMVKGDKSVNWLCRAIEAAHGIKGEA